MVLGQGSPGKDPLREEGVRIQPWEAETVRGEVETASMNDAKGKGENEGKPRDEATGKVRRGQGCQRAPLAPHPRNWHPQAVVKARHLNAWATPQPVRAGKSHQVETTTWGRL